MQYTIRFRTHRTNFEDSPIVVTVEGTREEASITALLILNDQHHARKYHLIAANVKSDEDRSWQVFYKEDPGLIATRSFRSEDFD